MWLATARSNFNKLTNNKRSEGGGSLCVRLNLSFEFTGSQINCNVSLGTFFEDDLLPKTRRKYDTTWQEQLSVALHLYARASIVSDGYCGVSQCSCFRAALCVITYSCTRRRQFIHSHDTPQERRVVTVVFFYEIIQFPGIEGTIYWLLPCCNCKSWCHICLKVCKHEIQRILRSQLPICVCSHISFYEYHLMMIWFEQHMTLGHLKNLSYSRNFRILFLVDCFFSLSNRCFCLHFRYPL